MPISFAALHRLADTALQHGGTHLGYANAIEWDVGAYCEAPLARTLHARGARVVTHKYKWSTNPGSLSVHLTGLPCRKCARCLFIRADQWKERSIKECAKWNRTWFVTLTLNPAWQHRVFMEEMAYRNSRGWRDADFDKQDREFILRASGAGKLLTKYFKTVRKPLAKAHGLKHPELPVNLRYISVFERHESGLPHMHLLMHEAGGRLTYDRICGRWLRYGFAHARLVDDPARDAGYVCKYITKDALCRIRASQHYGADRQTDFDMIMSLLPSLSPSGHSDGTER